MPVGQFPLMSDLKRRTVAAPQNPMDKSTVVSIFPKHIIERKHTIYPGVFEIPPGSYGFPSVLVVGSSSWWKEIDENQPLLEIPHSSIVIADSIVKDYCNGIVACDMANNMPGLFYLPGTFTPEDVKKTRKAELDAANVKQRNWFAALVKMADALWARSGGNPLTIADEMRIAARELNMVNKEWLKDSQTLELVRCVACGHLKNPQFPVCSNCKAISDPAKAKELGLIFVQ